MRVLARLGPISAEGIPQLIKFLDRQYSRWTRWAAVRVLGCIGPAALMAVPCLEMALNDSRAEVRRAAGEALELVNSRNI
jgi:HEAT repeat protein